MIPPRCEPGNHMMGQLNGEWHCYICENLERRGRKLARCKRGGHLYESNDRCAQCTASQRRPELVELFNTGRAECPRGHELTVETVKWSRQIHCRACAREHAEANGQRRIGGGRPELDVDWVLVLQYVAALSQPVELTEANHGVVPAFGHLTYGERWLVSCQNVTAHKDARPTIIKWRKWGEARNLPRLTLEDILLALPSEDYSEGRLLQSASS